MNSTALTQEWTNAARTSVDESSDMSSATNALRVSVIIPAYRAAETIGRAIESVLAQTYPAYEILVIDDGSPDDLTTALAPYAGRVTLLRQQNQGASAARNHGLDRAQGELVAFLDADDAWLPEKLETCVAEFSRSPEVGLVASRYFLQEVASQAGVVVGPADERCQSAVRVAPQEVLEFAREISTPTVVVRRCVLSTLRFDTGLVTAEDRDLWIRLLLATTVKLLRQPLCRVFYRVDSLSHGNIDVDCRCMLQVIERCSRQLGVLVARRERAYVEYKWAVGTRPCVAALRHWWRSLTLWPLPFSRSRTRCILARLRTLVAILRPGRGR